MRTLAPPRPSPLRFAAALLLAGIAAVEVGYGIAFAPVAGVLALDGPVPIPWVPELRMGVAAVVFAALSVAGAGLTGLASVGVATGSRVGWWLGMVGAILWLPTGCLPASLVAAAVLLLPDVRVVAFPPAPPEPPIDGPIDEALGDAPADPYG